MNSFWKKRSHISIIIVFALIVLGIFLFLSNTAKREKTTAIAEYKPLVRSIQTDAEVVYGANYTLSFQQQGVVDAVFVWSGKKVEKGELLVTISNSKERAAYKKAQNTLIKAQEKYRKVVGSSTQVLQEKVDEALADVVFAQAQAESTRATLEKTRVRAPIDSTVVSVATFVGNSVTPDITVVVLRDTKNNYLLMNLSEADTTFVMGGQQVVSTIEGVTYKGLVTGVFQNGDGYSVTSMLPHEALYEAKTPVKATITTAYIEQALVIPEEAIINIREATNVEIVRDERKTEFIPITTGLKGDSGNIQVIQGLTAGDRIVWKNTSNMSVE